MDWSIKGGISQGRTQNEVNQMNPSLRGEGEKWFFQTDSFEMKGDARFQTEEN